eukprot:7286839-Alexandrium_andersonii.AAC.1
MCIRDSSPGRLLTGAASWARADVTGHFGARLRGASCCYAKASSPIARCPSGGGSARALRGLSGGACLLYTSPSPRD